MKRSSLARGDGFIVFCGDGEDCRWKESFELTIGTVSIGPSGRSLQCDGRANSFIRGDRTVDDAAAHGDAGAAEALRIGESLPDQRIENRRDFARSLLDK